MKIAALAAVTALVVAGCGSSDTGSGNTVNWWTWDDKQAVAYGECEKAFEAANAGVDVKITRYNVDDYFTKLTAGFVAGTAPDAFQNSVQFLQSYASQHQLMPMDDLIAKSSLDMKKYSVGVDTWKFTDGKQYALPLDWAAAGIYYSVDALTKAGVSEADVAKMTWNPEDGGTFDKIVARLTVDKNGRRGDEPGFDKNQIATYGIGAMAGRSFIGETTWAPFVSTLGWRLGDKDQWPTKFNYTDPPLHQDDEVGHLPDRPRLLAEDRHLHDRQPVDHLRRRPHRLRQGRHDRRRLLVGRVVRQDPRCEGRHRADGSRA
ncbi:ABC transporter substrate-binding protein [Lentzea indica]|uniref:ABC transporter substrate-binding protein n=1 Tax=Lentzea indica TaxID=2604800 RepID=UPI001CB6BBD8|nr:extracellular solute-binding protein [Lentzea indica]